MMRSVKVRVFVTCALLALCFTIFSYRLIQLQLVEHDRYAMMAAEKHVAKQVIHARRGQIQDVNGEVLADNEPLRTVVADGSLIRKHQIGEMAHLMAQPLSMGVEELRAKLSTEKPYLILKKDMPEQAASELQTKLQAGGFRGIMFEHDTGRFYPNGHMLCHVLGFLDASQKGVQGVEKVMNDHLQGHNGYRFTERDRTGREIVLYRGQEREARDGANVRLTIDMALQSIVENELDEAVKQFRPKAAVAIMMRPKTGELLALANRPAFDPNQPGLGKPEQMRNDAIISLVEPGSTFKIVPVAAAINEEAASLESVVFCENGRFAYGGRTLKDHHGYGNLTVREVMAKSSNIGCAKLAMRLGEQTFYEYVRRFGFGERTGITLPGEITGMVNPPHRWSKISITRIPMGHEVAVTPLQMISAMSAIANGGSLMMPQIIRSVIDRGGNTLVDFQPVKVRQVVSPQTAALVRSTLAEVVSERGTASFAKVSGFKVAGKTGTAQKVDPKGGYMEGKYVVSFVGFLPAEDPEFACLVMVDEARLSEEQNYGGLVAAPVFSRIAERAARYLNLEPSPEAVSGELVLGR